MTGRDIDIQQLVTFAASGDTAGAMAMIINTMGEGFDSMHF